MDQNPQPQNQTPPPMPFQPPPMQPPANYNLPPKKSNAGLIVGIISGVVLLVGIIVAALVFILMYSSGPSQEDYKTALDDVKALMKEDKASYEKIISFYGVADTETESLRRAEQIKEYRKTISTKLDDLAKVKAVTDDKEVKEAYDKAKKEVSKYISALDMLAESYEKIAPENIKIKESYDTRDAEEVSRVMKVAILNFERILPELKSDANKKYIRESLAILKESVELLDSEVDDEEFSDKSSDIDNRSARLDKSWKNDMTKGLEEALIKTDTLKLEDMLKEKSTK